MATQHHSARHVAAQNTILLWLAGLIVLAGIGVFVVYYELRADGRPVGPGAGFGEVQTNASVKPALTDSSAEVARAHTAAIAEANDTDTPTTK